MKNKVLKYLILYLTILTILVIYGMIKPKSYEYYDNIGKMTRLYHWGPCPRGDKYWGDLGPPDYLNVDMLKRVDGKMVVVGQMVTKHELRLSHLGLCIEEKLGILTMPFLMICFSLFLFKHKEFFHGTWIMCGVLYIIIMSFKSGYIV